MSLDSFVVSQPAPQPDPSPQPVIVWDLVRKDIDERDLAARVKYGMALQGLNGRDSLIDAYQEALDLVVYLRQELFRRYGR